MFRTTSVNSTYIMRLWHSTSEKGEQLVLVAGVVEHAEVPPVDLEAFAGLRFHADVGAVGR
jgi:hypothetical protein